MMRKELWVQDTPCSLRPQERRCCPLRHRGEDKQKGTGSLPVLRIQPGLFHPFSRVLVVEISYGSIFLLPFASRPFRLQFHMIVDLCLKENPVLRRCLCLLLGLYIAPLCTTCLASARSPTLAVLNFASNTGDVYEDDMLSRGTSATIISDLMSIQGIRVVEREDDRLVLK